MVLSIRFCVMLMPVESSSWPTNWTLSKPKYNFFALSVFFLTTLLEYSAYILDERVIVIAVNQKVVHVHLTYLIKGFVNYVITHALLEEICWRQKSHRHSSLFVYAPKTDECSRCLTILMKWHLVESLGEISDPEAFWPLCPNPNKHLFHVGDSPSLVGNDFV